MRVIGGIYRGRRLQTPRGLEVRPTSDRLRETLFDVLAPQIEGARFLDICAGSGAAGIEALSRGASSSTFIELSRRACAVIEDNLAALDIDSDAHILNRDAVKALKWLASQEHQFDIAFFDPPYSSGLYSHVMETVAASGLLAADGILVVEHRAKAPPTAEYAELRIYRHLKQGESGLAFYARI
jgi:16S rRNA (guanine(966)-N(2))-methyltransferase RsmD